MERNLLTQLINWKHSPFRKPLILKGVRQAGKTWALKEFGRRHYANTVYFNFEAYNECRQFFETTKNVERLLKNLQRVSQEQIRPHETLIIFDEIQECPEALNSLKYFCENAPDYHVACASSFLDIAPTKPASFPVGKVNFIRLDPMTFTEFLIANSDQSLVNTLRSVDIQTSMPGTLFDTLVEKLKMYFITGGMPEAVRCWVESGDVAAIDETLSNILKVYERDFVNHCATVAYADLGKIWESIPAQLGQASKAFDCQGIEEGIQSCEYEALLQWLVDARFVHKISRLTHPGLPFAAYDDLSAFKVYFVDVGLLRCASHWATPRLAEGNHIFSAWKGVLTENFVLQSLVTQFEVMPRYWSEVNPPYEVDFLIQRENDIFSVEVKPDTNTRSISLKQFKDRFPNDIKLRIRYSLDNLKLDDDLLNIPLFMIDETDRLIALSLQKRHLTG